MEDRLDPRFAAAVRSALLEEVRTTAPRRTARAGSPAPRRPRWQPVLALGIAAVTIVAIVFGFSVASRTRSSPPAVQPLGGDCAEILTAAKASALIGVPLTLRAPASPLTGSPAVAVPVVHGLHCTWSVHGDAVDAAGVVLTVLPASFRPKGAKPATNCFGQNDGPDLQQSCNFEVVAGGRWTTGQVTGATGGTLARTRADVASLRRTIRALPAEQHLASADTSGWWSPISCATLDRRAALPEALGRPGLRVEDGNGTMVTDGQALALRRTVVLNCILETDSDTDPFGADVHAWAGAGDVVSGELTGDGVRRLDDVDGAKVYLVEGRSASPSALWVVADGGVVELSGGRSPRQLLPAVAPILKSLHVRTR